MAVTGDLPPHYKTTHILLGKSLVSYMLKSLIQKHIPIKVTYRRKKETECFTRFVSHSTRFVAESAQTAQDAESR